MKRLLKVTALMSSVTVINLILNLVKAKVIAVITGPAGVGLYGLFMSLYAAVVSVSSIASGGSVVKAVAEANSNNDNEKLYFIKNLLVTISLLIGLFISVIIFIFSDNISLFAFNNLE